MTLTQPSVNPCLPPDAPSSCDRPGILILHPNVTGEHILMARGRAVVPAGLSGLRKTAQSTCFLQEAVSRAGLSTAPSLLG